MWSLFFVCHKYRRVWSRIKKQTGISSLSHHLCHLTDALWIQAASPHLPGAGDYTFVCDGDDEARHRASLLLQSGIHHMPVANLHTNSQSASFIGENTSLHLNASAAILPCTESLYRERFLHWFSCSHKGRLRARSPFLLPHPMICGLWESCQWGEQNKDHFSNSPSLFST